MPEEPPHIFSLYNDEDWGCLGKQRFVFWTLKMKFKKRQCLIFLWLSYSEFWWFKKTYLNNLVWWNQTCLNFILILTKPIMNIVLYNQMEKCYMYNNPSYKYWLDVPTYVEWRSVWVYNLSVNINILRFRHICSAKICKGHLIYDNATYTKTTLYLEVQ